MTSTYLGSDGENDNKVYAVIENPDDAMRRKPLFVYEHQGIDNISYEKLKKNPDLFAIELDITHSEFKDYAAAVWAESSGDKYESFGIASAIMNIDKSGAFSREYLVSTKNNQVYGAKKHTFDYVQKNENRHQVAAVINALREGHDYSNGATFWDGTDLLTSGLSHHRFQKAHFDGRQGIHIPNASHVKDWAQRISIEIPAFKKYLDLEPFYNQNTNTDALFEVTNSHGHTIFFKHLPVNSGTSPTQVKYGE